MELAESNSSHTCLDLNIRQRDGRLVVVHVFKTMGTRFLLIVMKHAPYNPLPGSPNQRGHSVHLTG